MVSIEPLVFSYTTDALEGRKLITIGIPREFMQDDIEELVHVKF